MAFFRPKLVLYSLCKCSTLKSTHPIHSTGWKRQQKPEKSFAKKTDHTHASLCGETVEPDAPQTLRSMINAWGHGVNRRLRALCAQRGGLLFADDHRDKDTRCWDTLWAQEPSGRAEGCVSVQASASPVLTQFSRAHSAGNMSSLSVPPPERLQRPLAVPHRHMFGPGPSNVPPRILEAGAKPVIGHMHPEIFEVTPWV